MDIHRLAKAIIYTVIIFMVAVIAGALFVAILIHHPVAVIILIFLCVFGIISWVIYDELK